MLEDLIPPRQEKSSFVYRLRTEILGKPTSPALTPDVRREVNALFDGITHAGTPDEAVAALEKVLGVITERGIMSDTEVQPYRKQAEKIFNNHKKPRVLE